MGVPAKDDGPSASVLRPWSGVPEDSERRPYVEILVFLIVLLAVFAAAYLVWPLVR